MNRQATSRPIWPRRQAFTLIEIMVAIMVFSLVIAAIYSTWELVLRSSEVGRQSAAQAQRQRVVLRTIGDAVMGIESFQASQNLYWFKLANGDDPFLSFVARLPETYPRSIKFVGAARGHNTSSRRVTFSLAPGDTGEKNLILRQNPILLDVDQDEQQYPLILAKNVKAFTIEWWGTNEMNEAQWNSEWDDSQTNTIPQMLRVHLVMGANSRDPNAPDFAATRIYTVPSQMMPVQVQRGVGVGPGGPGGQGALGGLLQLPGGRK